jgi:hypothetical protein
LCQAAAKILVLVRRLWDSLAVDELPGGDHRRGLPARLPAAHMARTDARPTAAAGGDRATRATSRPFASGRFSLRAPAPVAPPLPAQYATRRDSWSGSAATRSISTESSNGCWPCSCASRTCGRGRSRADPFRKTKWQWPRARAGRTSLGHAARFTDRCYSPLAKICRSVSNSISWVRGAISPSQTVGPTAGVRKYRSLPEGAPNGSNRPHCSHPEAPRGRPLARQERKLRPTPPAGFPPRARTRSS